VENGDVLTAFQAESERFSQVLEELTEQDWQRPTACTPWLVRDLAGHVLLAVGRTAAMLEGPSPERAEVSAVEYYRPDERFSPQENASRVAQAQEQAAEHKSGAALAEEFARTWREIHRLCLAEPAGRVVVTRHGDAMLLSEFLLTRVVEVAVHGFDLAAALEREPWLTPEAGQALETLMLDPQEVPRVRRLGWDQTTFLRKATGRLPLTQPEQDTVRELGIRWLTLG